MKNQFHGVAHIRNSGGFPISNAESFTDRSVVPIEEEEIEEEPVDVDLKRLQDLIEAGEAAEAFSWLDLYTLLANLGLRNGC